PCRIIISRNSSATASRVRRPMPMALQKRSPNAIARPVTATDRVQARDVRAAADPTNRGRRNDGRNTASRLSATMTNISPAFGAPPCPKRLMYRPPAIIQGGGPLFATGLNVLKSSEQFQGAGLLERSCTFERVGRPGARSNDGSTVISSGEIGV